jgi:hypothetical protein
VRGERIKNVRKIKEHALSIRPTFKYACNNGDVEEVRKYIKEGYDCSKNDEEVSLASRDGYLEIVRLLLENGANCTALDNYAIRYASENGHLELVQLLLKHGADCTDYNNSENNISKVLILSKLLILAPVYMGGIYFIYIMLCCNSSLSNIYYIFYIQNLGQYFY